MLAMSESPTERDFSKGFAMRTLPEKIGLHRSYCKIDLEALESNIRTMKLGMSPGAKMGVVIKSNAYGHDARLVWRSFVKGGADWFCVDSLHEAYDLREDGYSGELFVMGHVPPCHAEAAAQMNVHCMVYDPRQVEAFAAAATKFDTIQRLIMKIETGVQRQGLNKDDALILAKKIRNYPSLKLAGICSHFANIEDTTDPAYANMQLARFNDCYELLVSNGFTDLMRSIANSASTILWPHTHYDLARVGITSYGMWPSTESFVSAKLLHKDIELKPAMTWASMVAQVKDVEPGEYVGYGCSFQTTHKTRLAVVPVGYYDGYHRAVSNLAHMLVHGRKAPVRGRICMNMCMIDVTDIDGVEMGDEVVMLGRQGDGFISAEQLGSWGGTINYEVTTQIQTSVPRLDAKAFD